MNCRILAVAAFALITLAPAGRSQVVESIELTAGPEAIASFAAAPHEGWLYVFGGHTGRPHHHSRENLSRRFWRIKADAPSTIEDLPGGDGLQGDALARMAGLHTRFAKMAVVDNEDVEVHRLRHCDCRQSAHRHQLLAVSGNDHNPAVRLRLSETKAHQGRASHRAP